MVIELGNTPDAKKLAELGFNVYKYEIHPFTDISRGVKSCDRFEREKYIVNLHHGVVLVDVTSSIKHRKSVIKMRFIFEGYGYYATLILKDNVSRSEVAEYASIFTSSVAETNGY